MTLLHNFTFLLLLKLFLALVLGLLLLPWIIPALIFLFLSLLVLFPAFCILFLALLLFKVIFKCQTKASQRIEHRQELKEQQVSLEMDSSQFSFEPCESEESKNEISETSTTMSRHFELWQTWHPQSVEISARKPFNELMSFWRRQEKLASEQR